MQQKDSDMQLQWMEGMNKHMDVPDGYAQVAVLIIKWSPELDDTHCQDEVRDYPDAADPCRAWSHRRSFAC